MRVRCGGLLAAWLLIAAPVHTATVHDDTGRALSLTRPAERIVTLAPHATELVAAAGAADRLVAVSPGPVPAGLRSALPRIGGPGALDREALMMLRPDLVIAWESGNRAADLDWIAHVGITLYRSEPRGLADVAASIRAIGALTGTRQLAAEAAAAFEQATRTPCAGLPPEPAFVLVWERPPMSLGGRHWINDVLRAAGFRNLFAGLDRGVFQIAPEVLLAAGPATLISLLPRPASGSAQPLAELLSRPGTRLPEAVQQLCRLRLHAEADR
jgi:iron complex transport system substrate-binding protein